MAERDIIVATDSRFRGLQDYLFQNRIPGSRTTAVKVLPGGTLLSCFHKIKSCVDSIKNSRLSDLPFSLTIAAGICDFTTKVKNGDASELCYPDSKLHSVISNLEFISSRSLTELKTPICFSTIPPQTFLTIVITSTGITIWGNLSSVMKFCWHSRNSLNVTSCK